MTNPFESIEARLATIESMLLDIRFQPEDKTKSELPDRIDSVKEAAKVAGTSESYLYKFTMPANAGAKDAPPFSRYNRRLIFSRSALIAWRDSRTIPAVNPEDVMSDRLAQSAKRKR